MNYLTTLETLVASLRRNNVDYGTINAVVADVVLTDRDEKVARATDRATVQAGRLLDHLAVGPVIKPDASFNARAEKYADRLASAIKVEPIEPILVNSVNGKYKLDTHHKRRSVMPLVNQDHTSTNLVPEWTAEDILRNEG